MAKFGVNVVVLVDNMPLVFLNFFPKPFKKNSCTAYNASPSFTQTAPSAHGTVQPDARIY